MHGHDRISQFRVSRDPVGHYRIRPVAEQPLGCQHRQQIGPVALDVHRAIKDALDPDGLLNPGKVFRRVAVRDLAAVGELTGR